MSTNFHILVKKSNDELHVNPSGDFDGSSAWELVNLLQEKYDGQGQVIIDTKNLLDICPFGCSTFQYRLNLSRVPADRLSFKGKYGHKIAPRGSRIIFEPVAQGCGCKNACANCHCTRKKTQ